MNAIVSAVSEQKLDFNERSDGSPAWLSNALKNIDASALWRYPQRQVLEQQLAERFDCNAENVLVSNGGDEAIDLVLRIAAKQKRALLLPLPAFSMYRVTAARNEVPVQEISASDDLTIDQAALLAGIAANQIIALTSPNNPTGEVLNEAFVRQVIEKAQSFGSVVLFDAAYAEFNEADFSAELARDYDNVFILRSFSKVYGMAALRVGYLLANATLLTTVRAITPPFNVSGISLQLAQQALNEESQRDQKRYVALIRQNIERVRTRLLALGQNILSSGGNFVLLRLNTRRAQFVASFLAQQHIRVRCFTEAELAGCLRITIPSDCERLLKSLEKAIKPQLLCLDMDGVLIDTSESYDACVAETVAQFSKKRIAQTAIQAKRNDGGFNDDWKLTQAILNDEGLNIDLATVTQAFQSFYEGKNGFSQSEKVLVSQQTAKTLRRFRTAVVTGRPANEALDGVHRMPWSIDALVSRDDVLALKPSPEGIEKMQKSFKTQLTWMIGDSVDDMRAARSADAVAIGVGLNNQRALENAGAHFVIDNINQLVELL